MRACVQWLHQRQKILAVRSAHRQWGDGWLAPDRLPLSTRLSLARSHTPFNVHLMEEVYHEILRVCGRPIEKSPWMFLPLDFPTILQSHVDQCPNDKRRRALSACAKWMTTNNLRRTTHLI